MGEVKRPRPALLIAAVFSRRPAALDWALRRCVDRWGPAALIGEPRPFVETQFYERTMGAGLLKQLVAFERLIPLELLVDCKLDANAWEDEYRTANPGPEARPLNIDPGYLTEAKLVLATTKDRDHRLYLARGIYAETTLHWQAGRWRVRDWTYPDYQRDDYHQFFTRCREFLRRRLHERIAPPPLDERTGPESTHGPRTNDSQPGSQPDSQPPESTPRNASSAESQRLDDRSSEFGDSP